MVTAFQKMNDDEGATCYLFFAREDATGSPAFFERKFYDLRDKDGKIVAFARDLVMDFDHRVNVDPERFYRNPEKFS